MKIKIILLTTVVFLQGCSAHVVSMMKKEPVYENFYLHENAKVGDTAVYYSPDQARYRYEYKIAGKKGDTFDITFRWIEGFGADIIQHFYVTSSGNVKRATIQQGENGEVFEKPIEGVNPKGFYSEYKLTKFATPQKLKIDNQTFNIQYARVYKINVPAGVDFIVVDLIDPSVPFGVVKSAQDVSVEKGMLSYSEFIVKAALPGVFSTSQALSAFINNYQQGDYKFKQHFVVQRYIKRK